MSELNKILGRDFIIAFLVPSLFMLVTSFLCLKEIGIESPWLEFDVKDPLKDSTILALEAFVLGILLQSINREIFRFAEGYWSKTNTRWLNFFQRKRFRWLNQEIRVLKAQKGECQRLGKPFEEQFRYNRLSEWAATQFPRREDLVLPTSFGNVVRAYEDYPRAVYGCESINGWSRIQTLISRQVTEVLSRARAYVDMWLNLSFATALLMVEIGCVTWKCHNRSLLWLLPIFMLFMLFAYVRARSSAARYGEQIKAVFDIYLPKVAQKLGFILSQEVDKNRVFWQAYSRMMVYRDAKAVEDMFAAGLKRPSAGETELNGESLSGGDEEEE